jgi:1-acyl-sn-glycerol-3-phosphate acyltransferase
MNFLLSVLFAVYFFASSAVLVCGSVFLAATTGLFDRNRRLLHMYASAWGHHYFYMSPFWSIEFEGKDLIDSKQTYVLVANHQSYFDIFALFGLFKPYKWVSKEEIFRMPFVGLNMKCNQYVCIARGNLKSIKEMLQVCRNWVNQGASVLMFPEGTRSLTGEIAGFKDGAFKIACDCKVKVVPIVIDGTFNIYPKGAKGINFKQKVKVKILPPVDPADFDHSAPKLRNYVHELMKETLAEMRQGKRLSTSAV